MQNKSRHAYFGSILILACALNVGGLVDLRAASFQGKSVTLIVGFGTGNGFDTYARLLSRHFDRNLPGRPNIIVQNMPGAGSLTALNYVLNKGNKDGTTLAMVNPVATIRPLLQPAKAKFDARKINWIGSMASDYYTCGFWTKKSVALPDLRKRKIVVGSTALTGGTYAGNSVLSSVLGLNFKNVAGYRSMGELVLAAERGEVEGHCGVMALTLKSNFWKAYKSGQLRIAVAAALAPDPDLAQIPNAFDMKITSDQRQLLTLLAGPWFYGRPIMAPIGLSADVVTTLRQAFDKTMNDERFKEEAKSLRVQINPLTGQKVTEVISKIYSIPVQLIERAKPMFGVGSKR